jgi:hypothetical protein
MAEQLAPLLLQVRCRRPLQRSQAFQDVYWGIVAGGGKEASSAAWVMRFSVGLEPH